MGGGGKLHQYSTLRTEIDLAVKGPTEDAKEGFEHLIVMLDNAGVAYERV